MPASQCSPASRRFRRIETVPRPRGRARPGSRAKVARTFFAPPWSRALLHASWSPAPRPDSRRETLRRRLRSAHAPAASGTLRPRLPGACPIARAWRARLRLGAATAAAPPLLLEPTRRGAVALVFRRALRTAAAGSVTGMEEVALRALTKLEQVLPARLRRRLAALHAADRPASPAAAPPSTRGTLGRHRLRLRRARPAGVRLPRQRRRAHQPPGRARRPGPHRVALVPGRLGSDPRRLADLPGRPHRGEGHDRRALLSAQPARGRPRRLRGALGVAGPLPRPRARPPARADRRDGATDLPATGTLESVGPRSCLLLAGAPSLDVPGGSGGAPAMFTNGLATVAAPACR